MAEKENESLYSQLLSDESESISNYSASFPPSTLFPSSRCKPRGLREYSFLGYLYLIHILLLSTLLIIGFKMFRKSSREYIPKPQENHPGGFFGASCLSFSLLQLQLFV